MNPIWHLVPGRGGAAHPGASNLVTDGERPARQRFTERRALDAALTGTAASPEE